MITLTYSCGGCDKVEKGQLRKSVGHGVFAKDVDINFVIRRSSTNFEDYAPEGWVAFDPYTSATYCAECWASIENGDDETESISAD